MDEQQEASRMLTPRGIRHKNKQTVRPAVEDPQPQHEKITGCLFNSVRVNDLRLIKHF